ncbi:MAG: n-acetylglutamate synthase [Lachnospiraceae bacterium]|nr:n-acetylglutamate synthase [Lachnospiraceae bacterium]
MEKKLNRTCTDIDYDGRCFVPEMNSENGEVSGQTVFTYHQSGTLLWAEYGGGDIVKGTLIGTVLQNGELDFVYQHMNREMQLRTGKCHSVPVVSEGGKLELSEEWEWTNGDFSKGNSLLVEQ